MTDTRHDEFEEAAAAYALDGLGADERRQFEAHLATCARCQADVAEYRRVTAGLGLAVEKVTPPASLKARTIARATQTDLGGLFTKNVRRPPRSVSNAWLAAAAGVMLAVATGIYAWSLRAQVDAARQVEAQAFSRAQALRAEMSAVRGDSLRWSRMVQVLTAPDLVRVDLAGTASAKTASGRAFWSRSRGLLLNADQLPALQASRIYQLWVVLPKSAPVSAGLFGVAANGSGTVLATLPASLAVPAATVITVAVTDEPAAGSAGPTTPILLAGSAKTE